MLGYGAATIAGPTPGAQRVPVSKQVTVARVTRREGIGLHSGEAVHLELRPGPADSGVRFYDLRDPEAPGIPARVSHAVDARLATTLGLDGRTVRTVEHLLAAVYGLGIDDLEVWLDADEPPVLDGSAQGWVEALREAGRRTLDAPRQVLRVTRELEVRQGESALRVSPAPRLELCTDIAFSHPGVGEQHLDVSLENGAFERELAAARTFGFEAEVAAMHAAGLARGGSLDNAVVFGDRGVLNPSGLRWPDEPVRHKALDLLGDLSLLGRPLLGRVCAVRPGHAVNHAFVEALLQSPEHWELV